MTTPLVLLPGLLCDGVVWQSQIEALGATAQCSVVEYGDRDSLRAMAEHALATAPAPRFSVAGHSMGGRVAFEMLRQAPERIERVALLDTSYHPLAEGEAGEAEKTQRLALLAKARAEGMAAMAREWAQGMVHPALHHEPVFDAVVQMLARRTPDTFAAQIKALLARPDCSGLLAGITCPTLLLCGREDAWSPPSRHDFMQRAVGGSHLVVVERCGHMSTMEQPDAVSDALGEWLLRSG